MILHLVHLGLTHYAHHWQHLFHHLHHHRLERVRLLGRLPLRAES